MVLKRGMDAGWDLTLAVFFFRAIKIITPIITPAKTRLNQIPLSLVPKIAPTTVPGYAARVKIKLILASE